MLCNLLWSIFQLQVQCINCNDYFWNVAVMSITFQIKWFFFDSEDFFFQNPCFKWFLKYIFSTICIDLWHCIHCVKFDLDDQRSIPIYTHNNCHIKEWSALIYKYKKYHKTTNVNTTSLGHVLCLLSQTQNWTVLSSTYIQL